MVIIRNYVQLNIYTNNLQIGIGEIDFREWYKSAEDLEKDENRDVYPPRFITQLNSHRRCTLDVTYTVNLLKDGTIVKDYKFSIYVKGTSDRSIISILIVSYSYLVINYSWFVFTGLSPFLY